MAAPISTWLDAFAQIVPGLRDELIFSELTPVPAIGLWMGKSNRGAITNGVTKQEITEVFLQAAIYCGMPAGVDSFRVARETFKEMGI